MLKNNNVSKYFFAVAILFTGFLITTSSAHAVGTQIPGKPNIAWMDSKQGSSFLVHIDMWWGENGTSSKLYENNVVVKTQTLVSKTPAQQSYDFSLTNKNPGTYNYKVELCNANGCSVSDIKTITVSSSTNATSGTGTSTTGSTSGTGTTTATQGEIMTPAQAEKIKQAVKRMQVTAGIPKVNTQDATKNPKNVQLVMSIVPENTWKTLVPIADPVYTYEEFLKAVAKFPSFCGEPNQTKDLCKRELATVFAHMNQETGAHYANGTFPERGVTTKVDEWKQGLYYVRELGCSETGAGCEYTGGTCDPSTWQGKMWKCKQGKKYYGRGAKQLSYNYNYGMFSDLMFGDSSVLLKNPDRVGKEGWLALSSALWFYMTPQSPKPSMHDVVVGLWKPNASDIKNGRTAGFGTTISIINGGVECGGAVEVAQAKNRISYYKSLTSYFGIPAGTDLGCANQKQFDANSSGALPNYWEQDWARSGMCKLVSYQTPHSVFKKGDYVKCVKDHFGITLATDPTEFLWK